MDDRIQRYLDQLAKHFGGIQRIVLKKEIESGKSGSKVYLVAVDAYPATEQKRQLQKRMRKMLTAHNLEELARRFAGDHITFTPEMTVTQRVNQFFEYCTQNPEFYPKLIDNFIDLLQSVAPRAQLTAEQFLIGQSGPRYLKVYTDIKELDGIKHLQKQKDPIYELMPNIAAYCLFQDRLHVLYEPAFKSIRSDTVTSLADLCRSRFPSAIQYIQKLADWMIAIHPLDRALADYPDTQYPHDLLNHILRPKRVKGPTRVQERAKALLENAMDFEGLLNARRIDIEGSGIILPNPLGFLEHPEWWQSEGLSRIRAPLGRSHGDLHSANIMCSHDSSRNEHKIEIIDFDDPTEEAQSIFFDFAYLEFDLIRRLIPPQKAQNRQQILNILQVLMFEREILYSEARIMQENIDIAHESYSLLQLINPLRKVVHQLVNDSPHREDLNNAFWLSCVAVGLNFLRKSGVSREERVLGLVYAAYALRCAFGLHNIDYRSGEIVSIPWTIRVPKTENDEAPTVIGVDVDLEQEGDVRRWRRDYLKKLLHDVGRINLTQILKNAPKDEVNLKDVFVPINTDVRAMIRIENGEFQKWWLLRTDESESDTRPLRQDQSLPEFELAHDTRKKWGTYLKQTFAPEPEDETLSISFDPRRTMACDIDILTAMSLVPNLVITGEPGSGKSTALRYMAMCMAGELLDHEGENATNLKKLAFWPLERPLIPIYIELRTLVRSAFPNTATKITVDVFMDYIQTQLHEQGVATYYKPLQEEMRDGIAMIFLDGLDEIPDADHPARKLQVVELINMLRSQYPHCRIIVTARTYAYREPLDGFGRVHLTTLARENRMPLATNLFQQILVNSPGEVISKELNEFGQALDSVNDDLLNNPLFFSLIVTIWLNNIEGERKALPSTIGEMYRSSVEMMINRWTSRENDGEESIATKIGLDRDRLKRLLEVLAFRVHNETHEGDDAVFESGHVFTIIRRDLGIKPKHNGEKHVDYDQLIEHLAKRAGIIHEVRNEIFQFTHRSFQEHLSASYLADVDYPNLAADCLRDNPALWHNVIELFPAEVESRGREIWRFAAELLLTNPPATPDHPHWYAFYHAYRIMVNYNLPEEEDWRLYKQELERPKLKRMIALEALSPAQRNEMGEVLAVFGDDRSGVGIDPISGTPDIQWKRVASGKFTQGATEKEVFPDEVPSDMVIPNAVEIVLPTYEISRFPITFAQYQAFIDDHGYENRVYWTNEGWSKIEEGRIQNPPRSFSNPLINIPNHPVRGISWHEAVAYTRWLSDKLNQNITLPTESQWEKAARGTDKRQYTYEGHYNPGKQNAADSQIRRPCSVGIFPSGASLYGVEDMCGNVLEWTLTKWRDNYEQAENNFVEAVGRRVVRGGMYSSNPRGVRVISRQSMFTIPNGFDLMSTGFRVVRNLE